MIIPKVPGFTIGVDSGAVIFAVRNTTMNKRTGGFKREAIHLALEPEEAINVACRLILAAWKAQEANDHG